MAFSQAPGASYRTVKVDEILLSAGVAMVLLPGSATRQQVALLPSRTGLLPRVGESWVIDREFGFWSFAALATSRLELFAPASAYHYRAHASTTQSVAASTPTAVAFDAVELDVGDGHTSPTVYAAPAAGWYDVRATFTFAQSADTSSRSLWITHNGQQGASSPTITLNGPGTLQITDAAWCAQGDTLSIMVDQQTPAALSSGTPATLDIWWRTP